MMLSSPSINDCTATLIFEILSIFSGNVLLDKELNEKLGDFRLARMHQHNQVATTTRVVEIVGCLASKVIKTGRASTQTDVFSFRILILEVEMVLHLGLLCAHPDPKLRPTMRQIVKALEGENKKEGGESEAERMEVYLLEKMKSQDLWSKYAQTMSSGSASYSHPTFGEVQANLKFESGSDD
ncbi:hypothetical protein L1887_24376 [Cichorium endivia]|nr:hypothetical protein L1887_24376 [Cichorium endivia]